MPVKKKVLKKKKVGATRKIVSKTKKLVRAGASAHPSPTPHVSLPPVSLTPKSMPRPAGCRIISICNQKGGCGKTTSVINIAAGLALRGQRVLVVDLDSQGNATSGLGISQEDIDKSTYDLLADLKNTSVEDVILETGIDNLHIAPGTIELSEFESKVASEIGRENRLKKALAPLVSHYDFIIIDTPPSLGLLSINALNAANEVQIALQAHPFAFDGLHLLLESIELVQEELNPALNITGIIITMFDTRTKISQEIVQKVVGIKELRGLVFKSYVHQNIKLTEASRQRKPIYFVAANCQGAHDYINLSEEIARQNKVAKLTAKTPSKSKSSGRDARA